jgi:hypothetical protein
VGDDRVKRRVATADRSPGRARCKATTSYDALPVTNVSATAMAAAFGLGQPLGPAQPVRQRGQVQAWSITTSAGRVLVKRFWADEVLPWRDQLERAMQIEQKAIEAGIDTPPPIHPTRPMFGSVARIDGHGDCPTLWRTHERGSA